MQNTNELTKVEAAVVAVIRQNMALHHLNQQPCIGIGITTHNRPQQIEKTLEEVRNYAPLAAKIVVVDDASKEPVAGATYRFDTNVGIAVAKNKCLELLEDCEHIFLFDDDTYPVTEGWHLPYINSGEPHLMYIFKDFKTPALNDTIELYRDSKIVAYSHPRGCMLYFRKEAIRAVGGMRPEFGKWGYEHPDLSNRIFNKGLTRFRYMDVPGSDKLFYSGDEHQSVISTVHGMERTKCIQQNKPKYDAYYYDSTYIPYKTKRNLVLTTVLTGVVDPQKGRKWSEGDTQGLGTLMKSVHEVSDWDMVILTDKPIVSDVSMDRIKVATVQSSINPYFQRWIAYYDYLKANRDSIDFVFCVDATDVAMLRTPTPERGVLYTGDEDQRLNCEWMVNNHQAPRILAYLNNNPHKQLLNAGVAGGDVDTVLRFIRMMIDESCLTEHEAYMNKWPGCGQTDMGLFNYVAQRFNPIHGGQVNTRFKAYEMNSYSWFKHK